MSENKKDIVSDEKKDDWLTLEEKAIIRKQFFPPNATDIDIIYCMQVAKSFRLNPILKQIYFVERSFQVDNVWYKKIEPLAGRDSFLTLAHRSKRFEGMESSTRIEKIPYINSDGEWEEKNELVATAIVYVKGASHPTKVSVNYSEYVQTKKNGDITKFWVEKPHTMLKKVAESQALRKAFDITGLYDESEINNNFEKVKTDEKENISADLSKFATNVEDAIEGEVCEVEENKPTEYATVVPETELKEMEKSLDE